MRAPGVRRRTSRRKRWRRRIRRQVGDMGIDARRRRARDLRYGRPRGEARRARSARRCACPRRSTSCCAPRRPDRLEHVPARARARAALRVHASRTARSSTGGSVTTRSPKAYAMLFDHRMQDPRLAGALHGAVEGGDPAVPAQRRFRGAAVPAPLLREADLRNAALWRRRAVARAPRPLRRQLLTDATSFRYDPRRRVRGRGSALLRGALPARLAASGAARRDAGRAVRRGLVAQSARRPVDRERRCSRTGSASWRTSRRSACRARHLSFAPLVRNVERLLG